MHYIQQQTLLLVMLGYSLTIAALLCLLLCIIYRRRCCRYPHLTDYPILGMSPPVLLNLTRIHDFVTDVLKQHHVKTGEFMGPWFTKMNFIVTSDPINVSHIAIKNLHNYVKGREFREIFQAFGGTILSADYSDKWKSTKSLFHLLIKQRSFELFYEKATQKKVQSALLPLLDHVQKQGTVVDLQDVFKRFAFDSICSTILGLDPGSLSIDFPEIETEKAFNEAEECMFYRNIVPKCVWKLQKWLQIGPEKKMSRACRTVDQFLYSCIESMRKELNKNEPLLDDQAHVDMPLLRALMRENKGKAHEYDDKFLRNSVYGLLEAGRSTITSALTWFFWLVAKNPLVEAKILEEIKDNFGDEKKLVYLHGAMCETIRLYPPVPFERKQAIESDVLPSGHPVHANAMILISLYAMGRFQDVWGEDCLEFKPERWISEGGCIVYVPSYKFFSFSAGPRTCLGKDLSFIQLKMVAAAILRNYRVHPVEGHVPTPSYSIILLMKNGFKVRITKRET